MRLLNESFSGYMFATDLTLFEINANFLPSKIECIGHSLMRKIAIFAPIKYWKSSIACRWTNYCPEIVLTFCVRAYYFAVD